MSGTLLFRHSHKAFTSENLDVFSKSFLDLKSGIFEIVGLFLHLLEFTPNFVNFKVATGKTIDLLLVNILDLSVLFLQFDTLSNGTHLSLRGHIFNLILQYSPC